MEVTTEKQVAQARGVVYLVGAGPGDPGLITVKGLDRLREADVVVYDYLADPSIVRQAPEDAGTHIRGEERQRSHCRTA